MSSSIDIATTRSKKRKITKEKKGDNAMNVICNKDLFLHIQKFTNGIERMLIDFKTKHYPYVNTSKLLEEALDEGNFNITDKLYSLRPEISDGFTYFFELKINNDIKIF